MTDIKSFEGKSVTVIVSDGATPCKVAMDGARPLRHTTVGSLTKVSQTAAGQIAIVEQADGKRFAFDAGVDIHNGKIKVEANK